MPDRSAYPIAVLIAVAAVAFVVRPTDQGIGVTVAEYGVVPHDVQQAWTKLAEGQVDSSVTKPLWRLVTALFVHGSFEHILYNMVFLWTFGSLVARHLGPVVAVAGFALCGVVGNLVQVWLNPDSTTPIVGASGAICGFEAVYLGLALRWHLPDPDVWPLAHPIPPLQLGLFAVVGFLFDAYSLMNHDRGVAYGAHMGGFMAGLAVAGILTTIYPTRAAWRRGSS